MVQDLIQERSWRQQEAVDEISNKWGKPQTIVGPVLTVPYQKVVFTYNDDQKKDVEHSRTTYYAHFLPEELDISGAVEPDLRYRGIFKAVVYNTELSISGQFQRPDLSELGIHEHILWNDAFISFGVSDLRGIQEQISIDWNGTPHDLEPGLRVQQVISSGVASSVELPDSSQSRTIPFSMKVVTNGSSFLEFTPVGKVTTVDLSGPWADPKFQGAFLPDQREINEDFSASWKVLHLNRSYPQSFLGSRSDIIESSFGVELLLPVDEYHKNDRAAKYAVMFISLTFMVFFFIQVLNKVRIHPVQYLLVGLGLCVFYTLLLSISEHLSFTWAYLLSSLAIILLVSGYSKFVFKSPKMAWLLFLIMLILYGFIFVIIQMQDYSLLVGSIGLFTALASAMYLSRKVEWYGAGSSEKKVTTLQGV